MFWSPSFPLTKRLVGIATTYDVTYKHRSAGSNGMSNGGGFQRLIFFPPTFCEDPPYSASDGLVLVASVAQFKA